MDHTSKRGILCHMAGFNDVTGSVVFFVNQGRYRVLIAMAHINVFLTYMLLEIRSKCSLFFQASINFQTFILLFILIKQKLNVESFWWTTIGPLPTDSPRLELFSILFQRFNFI